MTRSPSRPLDDAPLVIELEPDDGSRGTSSFEFGAAWPGDTTPTDLTVDLEPSAISAATSRAVLAVKGLVEANGVGEPGWAPSSEPVREVASVLMTHYLLGPPDELARAVARFWGERNGRARSLWGSVRLRSEPLDRPVVQGWRGHMRLRTSPVAIPVELDVERWRSVGLMVTLRPARLHARIGAHRRWAWFATGHGVLEQMRLAAERDDRPG